MPAVAGAAAIFLPTFVLFMNHSFLILFLNLGTGEIFLIMMFILIFFGADKLPEMARTLGKGMREMKNATAEIQREIEKSATEVQRNMNMEGQLTDIKEASDNIKKSLTEGLTNLENHYSQAVEEPKQPEEDPNNPLVPPDAVKRT